LISGFCQLCEGWKDGGNDMFFKRLKQLKRTTNYDEFLATSEIIRDSHKRCRQGRVNANLTQMPTVLTDVQVKKLLEDSGFLLTAAWPIVKEDLYRNFTNEDQLIILCNGEGYAIALMSSPKALELCYSMNLGLGTCFGEEVCGTNAIAVAMHLKKMVVIKGEQHYCQLFKDWSCVAAPIRSPGGDIVGYLDVSMDSEEELGHTLALVQAAVICIEQKMYIEKLLGEMTPKVITSPETLGRFETLSAREKQIFSSMAKGQTAGEIAGALGISKDTVGTYRKRIYKKLGIKRKIDCSNKARELGLLSE